MCIICKISSYHLHLTEVGHWTFLSRMCICIPASVVTVGRNHHLELFIACVVFHWFLLSWASTGDPERTCSHESVTTSCYYCK